MFDAVLGRDSTLITQINRFNNIEKKLASYRKEYLNDSKAVIVKFK